MGIRKESENIADCDLELCKLIGFSHVNTIVTKQGTDQTRRTMNTVVEYSSTVWDSFHQKDIYR